MCARVPAPQAYVWDCEATVVFRMPGVSLATGSAPTLTPLGHHHLSRTSSSSRRTVPSLRRRLLLQVSHHHRHEGLLPRHVRHVRAPVPQAHRRALERQLPRGVRRGEVVWGGVECGVRGASRRASDPLPLFSPAPRCSARCSSSTRRWSSAPSGGSSRRCSTRRQHTLRTRPSTDLCVTPPRTLLYPVTRAFAGAAREDLLPRRPQGVRARAAAAGRRRAGV